jgi:hypothetical protein
MGNEMGNSGQFLGKRGAIYRDLAMNFACKTTREGIADEFSQVIFK